VAMSHIIQSGRLHAACGSQVGDSCLSLKFWKIWLHNVGNKRGFAWGGGGGGVCVCV
jgi:hypothetical protein